MNRRVYWRPVALEQEETQEAGTHRFPRRELEPEEAEDVVAAAYEDFQEGSVVRDLQLAIPATWGKGCAWPLELKKSQPLLQ